MMMAMSALGLVAYARAMRDGLTRSKCVLRKPKLVLLYLSSCFRRGSSGDRRAHRAMIMRRGFDSAQLKVQCETVGHTEVDHTVRRESSPAPSPGDRHRKSK